MGRMNVAPTFDRFPLASSWIRIEIVLFFFSRADDHRLVAGATATVALFSFDMFDWLISSFAVRISFANFVVAVDVALSFCFVIFSFVSFPNLSPESHFVHLGGQSWETVNIKTDESSWSSTVRPAGHWKQSRQRREANENALPECFGLAISVSDMCAMINFNTLAPATA